LAKKGLFRPRRGSPRGGFYINPSRRPPRNPKIGVLGGFPGKAPKRAFFAHFGLKSPKMGVLGLPGPGGASPASRDPRGTAGPRREGLM